MKRHLIDRLAGVVGVLVHGSASRVSKLIFEACVGVAKVCDPEKKDSKQQCDLTIDMKEEVEQREGMSKRLVRRIRFL